MGSTPFLGSISGSRAATILGLNSFQTLYALWQIMIEEIYPGYNESMGAIMPPPVDNPAVRWGSALESAIITLSEKKAGCKIISREKLCRYKKLKGIPVTCHIDGEYKGRSILHQGKTTNIWNFNEWGAPGTDRVTDYVAAQVQHELLCREYEQSIVGVLVFPKRPDEWEKEGWIPRVNDKGKYKLYFKKDGCLDDTTNTIEWAAILSEMGFFHQYPIAVNTEAHKLMLDKYEKFYRKHIIEKIPPEPESYDDIKRCFPKPVGTIIADEKIEMLAAEYSDIGKEIGDSGSLKKRQDAIKIEILNYARRMEPVIDKDTMEKLIIYDNRGNKIGSFGKNKNGTLIYRGKD